MHLIIVSTIVLTALLLSLLLSKNRKLDADKFLILYFTISLFNQLFSYFEPFDFLQHSRWLLLGKGFYLVHGPLFFFYVAALTRPRALPMRWYLFALIPFVAYVIHFFVFYFQDIPETSISIQNGLLYINGELSRQWTFFVGLFILTDPVYIILFYMLLRRYKTKLQDSLSYSEKINLSWLRVLFVIWVISAVLLAPMSVLSISTGWITTAVMESSLAIANMLSVFIIGYYGFKQTTVFSSLTQEMSVESKPASYERSGLSKEQAAAFHAQLLEHMKREKPYLNGELSARELAESLGISVNHLSQVLNQEQQQNFFDFVNAYRVAEVKERMADKNYRQFTLLAIAMESGFNSKTSFNTLFRKFTGQTPSSYYKSINSSEK